MCGSNLAGHTGYENEILSIIEGLREDCLSMKLYKVFKLHTNISYIYKWAVFTAQKKVRNSRRNDRKLPCSCAVKPSSDSSYGLKNKRFKKCYMKKN